MKTLTYPGMDCDGIEFYSKDNHVRFIHRGTVTNIMEIPPMVLGIIKKEIDNDPMAKEELQKLFPDSEFKQVEKFIACRFGGLDFTPDISADGNVQDGEYIECPLRGKCASEGVLCRHVKYKDQILSQFDIKLMKLLSTTMTNDVIASELGIPLGSFHVMKKDLYKKLGNIQTKQELTLIGAELNIIKFKSRGTE